MTWQGPSGGAYGIPRDATVEEMDRLQRRMADTFANYCSHAQMAWRDIEQAITEQTGLPAGIVHTGGGCLTMYVDMGPGDGSDWSARIMVGVEGPDPEPAEEDSVGFEVYAPGSRRGYDDPAIESHTVDWFDEPYIEYDKDRTMGEYLSWMIAGIRQAMVACDYLAANEGWL